MGIRKLAIFMVALVTISMVADKALSAADIYVESSGTCGGKTPCYSTIQEAIDAAISGDTIKISKGSYDEGLNLSESKELTLRAGWDTTFTSQASNTSVNSITISNSGTVTVEHLVLFTPSSTYTNSLGQTFKLIPPGTFIMGSPEDELGRNTDETSHQVTLSGQFYMQTTEVTQGQWEKVMGSNPSHFSSCGTDCPVETVSWHDVQQFITLLNTKGEGTYRLPTEAEWEYALRAGTLTAFPNGAITNTQCDDPNLTEIGWYCGNSDDTTHPFAQKQPNAWGLYDMNGNVYEWCRDFYETYPSGPAIDPKGPFSGTYRVLRGGYWSIYAQYCRSATRDYMTPGYRHNGIGFRLVREP